MKLAYAILADAAEASPSGKVSMIGGDFETIVVTNLPSMHMQSALVAKFLLEESECDAEHKFELVIEDPDHVQLMPPLGGRFNVHLDPSRPTHSVRFLMAAALPPLVLLKYGEHKVSIRIDGHEQGSVSFFVEKAPESLNSSVANLQGQS